MHLSLNGVKSSERNGMVKLSSLFDVFVMASALYGVYNKECFN